MCLFSASYIFSDITCSVQIFLGGIIHAWDVQLNELIYCLLFSWYVSVLSASYIFSDITCSVQIEMMSEVIDETLDKDEAEEETEELTNQVRVMQISRIIILEVAVPALILH